MAASNSTFFDNRADASGGAIDNESGGNLSLTNATVSSNDAANGGGIENNGGTLSLQNTIVAGNYGNSGPDIDGVITTDNGNNLLGTAVNNTTTIPTPGPNDVFSDTPMLGTLADYGGPTQTLALLAGSPAIGAGNASARSPRDRPARPAPRRQRQPRHRRFPDAAAGVGFQLRSARPPTRASRRAPSRSSWKTWTATRPRRAAAAWRSR